MVSVRKIGMAPAEKRAKLLEETDNERHPWILTEGPGMIATLKKFSIFVRCPEEVCISESLIIVSCLNNAVITYWVKKAIVSVIYIYYKL